MRSAPTENKSNISAKQLISFLLSLFRWSLLRLTAAAEGVADSGRPLGAARDLGAGCLPHDIGAPVHLVDNGGISVGEAGTADVGATDGSQVVQIFSHHGETAAAKSGGSVVHKRAVIVFHAKVGSSSDFVEVMLHVALDILEHDGEVTVTVGAALFVVKTDSVAELVSDDSGVDAAAGSERDLVATMVVPNRRVASAAAEDLDVVVVTSGARLCASVRDKLDAGLLHPHSHALVDGIHCGA